MATPIPEDLFRLNRVLLMVAGGLATGVVGYVIGWLLESHKAAQAISAKRRELFQ